MTRTARRGDQCGRLHDDMGFEVEGPSTLLRAGIRKRDFAPGTKLTITGHPMRDGRPAAAWIRTVTDDGKELNPRAGFAIR